MKTVRAALLLLAVLAAGSLLYAEFVRPLEPTDSAVSAAIEKG